MFRLTGAIWYGLLRVGEGKASCFFITVNMYFSFFKFVENHELKKVANNMKINEKH